MKVFPRALLAVLCAPHCHSFSLRPVSRFFKCFESFGQSRVQVANEPTPTDRLWRAIHDEDKNVVEALLQCDSDAGEEPTLVNSLRNGVPHLVHAAQKGSVELVDLLLKHGADVNAATQDGPDIGKTALRMAVRMCQPSEAAAGSAAGTWEKNHEAAEAMVRSLLNGSQKVDTETRDRYGKTALMVAVSHCRPAVVKLLLKDGADYEAGDYERPPRTVQTFAEWNTIRANFDPRGRNAHAQEIVANATANVALIEQARLEGISL